MSLPDAFYHRDADRFVPSLLTRGPWDPTAQHGGPPAALVGTLIERNHGRPAFQTVRATVEILGPIPIAPHTVTTAVVRSGRSVEVLSGSLRTGGKEILRVTLLRIRTVDPLPFEEGTTVPAPAGPSAGAPARFFPTGHPIGYHSAVEVSFLSGEFNAVGPAVVWMRARYPLLAGEEMLPLARVLMAADSGNGVSSALDYHRWIFINPDLTVYLHRLPATEWVCLDARTTVERYGIGLAESQLFDEQGRIGRSLQGLFIAERG